MNKILISGNIVEKPELRKVGDVESTTLKVAVPRKFAKEGQQTTDFFSVRVWRGLANNCVKFLDKGRKVLVSGFLSIDTYKDKNGDTKTSVYVTAEDVEFMPSANRDNAEMPSKKVLVEESSQTESLPF